MPEQMTVTLKELFPESLWNELYLRAARREGVYTSHILVTSSGEVKELIVTPEFEGISTPMWVNSNANHLTQGIEGVSHA